MAMRSTAWAVFVWTKRICYRCAIGRTRFAGKGRRLTEDSPQHATLEDKLHTWLKAHGVNETWKIAAGAGGAWSYGYAA